MKWLSERLGNSLYVGRFANAWRPLKVDDRQLQSSPSNQGDLVTPDQVCGDLPKVRKLLQQLSERNKNLLLRPVQASFRSILDDALEQSLHLGRLCEKRI